MTISQAEREVRQQFDRMRAEVGADPVEPQTWLEPGVREALQSAAQCAVRTGFDGDWLEADLEIEDAMKALGQAVKCRPRGAGEGSPPRTGARLFPSVQNEAMKSGCLPALTRTDVGSDALAEYLSWHLKRDGLAQETLARVCGGRHATREEAWHFLTASLPKVMEHKDYERLGLCPLRTSGRILSKYLKVDGLLFFTNMLMIDPGTGIPTATTDTLKSDHGHYCVEVDLPDGSSHRQVLHRSESEYLYVAVDHLLPQPSKVIDPAQGQDYYIHPFPAPYFGGESRYVEGYGQSVMGEIIAIAEFLCSSYSVTIWSMLEALLTGRLPPQAAIEVFGNETSAYRTERVHEPLSSENRSGAVFGAQGPATLTVQPWVTPETLADVWRTYRKQNPAYSPSEKQADALRFVLSHTPPGEDFEWEQLARLWQQERGESMTRGRLYEQFRRARAAILPDYQDVGMP